MAAGWLARKLGLPVYRVDLASIISSAHSVRPRRTSRNFWLGPNGRKIVLLFDEADSLLASVRTLRKRTIRFANAQTNYLLQQDRVIRRHHDPHQQQPQPLWRSLTRRLDMIVDFPLPGPEERRAPSGSHIWERIIRWMAGKL